MSAAAPTPRSASTPGAALHIGDVAERTGLSLRTIRHYEEVGLLPETERTPGGFRLYTDEAVARLELIKQMKPLGFTLEQMGEIIDTRRRLTRPRLSVTTRARLEAVLADYQRLADDKLAALRREVANAEAFAAHLREPLG